MLVLVVLMVSYASSMRAYLEQKHHLESLRASIAESQANIAHLQREQKRWKDPAFIEAQARERFGWAMVGETSYQVIDENGQPLAGDDSLTESTTTAEDESPLWWQKAWGSVRAAGNPPEEQPPPVDQIRAPKPVKR